MDVFKILTERGCVNKENGGCVNKENAIEWAKGHIKGSEAGVEVCVLSGGCIAESFILKTKYASYVLKINPSSKMTEAESSALQELSLNQDEFYRVPIVYASCENYLLMEYVLPQGQGSEWQLAKALASLHRQKANLYGKEDDNFIGSSYQSNKQNDNWANFFWEERIFAQLKAANKKGFDFTGDESIKLEKCVKGELAKIEDQIEPRRLHGDLWSGNYFWDGEKIVLIDPATYYGHWEADLSMLGLFGGIEQELISSYQSSVNWDVDLLGLKERAAIYQLYHALNHFNLFGGSYKETSKQLISKITSTIL